jgi:hypothetical protein
MSPLEFDASRCDCANQSALHVLNILRIGTSSTALFTSRGFCKMRTVIGALLISATCISTAFAQQSSWAMDHGHAADAAAAARAETAAVRAKTFTIAAKIPRTPSQRTDFSVNGRGVVKAAAPLSPGEQKAEAEARAAWQARCRPTVIENREGLRRTQYTDSNCDLSRYNTAGIP